MSPALGFTIQPDVVFLDVLHDLIRELPDFLEVAPETLWTTSASGALISNGFHRMFRELIAPERFFVAHGVGFSLGTSEGPEAPRTASWLAKIKEDHQRFDFAWYTDHLGASSLGGLSMTLPVPIPMTAQSAAQVRARLALLASVVPRVGLENSVSYFLLGEPLREPDFLNGIVDAQAGFHLLLDLHNVYTMALNFDFDPQAYLRRLDLSKVIELHISGGHMSPAEWLPSGRSLRLDSHEDAVPEPVWELLEQVLPRCPNLRGLTLERMENTVTAQDAPLLKEELRRARGLLEAL